MASLAAPHGRDARPLAEGQLVEPASSSSSSSHGRSAHDDTSSPLLSDLDLAKMEEIVCIAPRPEGTGYDVFSLQEEDRAFRLTCRSSAAVPRALLDGLLVSRVPDYLRADDAAGRQVHLVVSTRSGTGHASDFYDAVLGPLLRRLGLAPETAGYSLTVTQDARSIQTFARGLAPDRDHTIVLMSGDGGIVELLNGHASAAGPPGPAPAARKPLVAPLPLGTGNALFNSLHKPVYAAYGSAAPTPLALGLRTLLRGRAAPLPSFRVDFSPGARRISTGHAVEEADADAADVADEVSHLHGAIVASYGFHSQLVWESDTPAYRRHGDKRFGMVAAELLKESHGYEASVRMRVTGSGSGAAAGSPPARSLARRRHGYILATLVSNLERTFTVSPASQPLDGQLRLVHFGAVDGAQTMAIMMQAYDGGKHVDMRWPTIGAEGDKKKEEEGEEEEGRVGYEAVDEVHVATRETDARWRKVCVDGAIVELPPGGSMAVRSGDAPLLQILVDPSLCS